MKMRLLLLVEESKEESRQDRLLVFVEEESRRQEQLLVFVEEKCKAECDEQQLQQGMLVL